MARKQGSHAGITGPKVHAAALRLFAQNGYAAVSMRQIAAEVGVQAGALYNYTPDKQNLLFDLMRGHLEELMTAWAQEIAPDAPEQRLAHFTRFHIRFHMSRADQVFVAYMELRNLTDAHFAQVEALRRAYEDVLEDILIAGQAQGCFMVKETRVTTMALIALLTGLGDWYRSDGRLAAEEIEDIYQELVRKAVAA